MTGRKHSKDGDKPNNRKENFSEKLQYVLRRSGFTQEEFASRMGVSRPTLSNYLRGSSKPDFVFLKKLCKEFMVNASWLLSDDKAFSTERNVADAIIDYVSWKRNVNMDSTQKENILGILNEDLSVINNNVKALESKIERILNLLQKGDSSEGKNLK